MRMEHSEKRNYTPTRHLRRSVVHRTLPPWYEAAQTERPVRKLHRFQQRIIYGSIIFLAFLYVVLMVFLFRSVQS
jgi:hypothetical protein